MKDTGVLKASLAFILQFFLPFTGGGYVVLKEYKRAVAWAFAFFLLVSQANAFPTLQGQYVSIQSFGLVFVLAWYVSGLQCLYLGVKSNRSPHKPSRLEIKPD